MSPRSGTRRATRARAPAAGGSIGVLGGTFDPPHFGHVLLARWAAAKLKLDRVLFVPAGRPPHKANAAAASAAHRLAMTRLAVRGQPGFAVEALETRRRGPSYTVDTVRALAARWPGAKLHLIMGADMFATFDTWREPEAIAERAVLAVLLRPGARAPKRSRAAAHGQGVVKLRNPGLPLSSSALRARARRGLSLEGFVPDPVARYVERHALYRRGRAPRGARSPRTGKRA
jgi:nicotinate-nucleotide adenylyltransferase